MNLLMQRSGQKNNMDKNLAEFVVCSPFELYYSTGGHGGPHMSWPVAWDAANRLLDGNVNEKWIDIVSRNTHSAFRVVKKTGGDTELQISPRNYKRRK